MTSARALRRPLARPVTAAADVVAVAVFAAFGRGAHSKGFSVGELWSTTWPFLIGLGVGWAGVAIARARPETVRSGVGIWAATLVGGMTVWGIREGKVPHWSFMIVAGTATALFLVGWRAVAAGVRGRGDAAR